MGLSVGFTGWVTYGIYVEVFCQEEMIFIYSFTFFVDNMMYTPVVTSVRPLCFSFFYTVEVSLCN